LNKNILREITSFYLKDDQHQAASFYDPSSFNLNMTHNNIDASYYPNPHSTPQIQHQYQQQPITQQQQQQHFYVPNSSNAQSLPQNSAQNILFNNPMLTSMAVDYSAKLADEGKAYVTQNVHCFTPNYLNYT
jgi:hypothetical protein